MKLRDALRDKQFVVTTEVQASRDIPPEELMKSLKPIKSRVDGVSISKSELRWVVGDTVQTCRMLNRNRLEPIYQTTTRDKNRLQLQSDLLDAYSAGVDNLLVFTEDYRITGDSLQEMMFFHVDAGKLQSVLEHIRSGQTVEGKSIDSGADFLVGSGVESGWGKNVPDLEMREMEEMTKIGAGYFLTTPVFDLDSFSKFLQQTNTFGVPVIAEVMILRTAGMGQFVNRHLKSGLVPEHLIERLARAPETLKASVDIFAEIVNGLREICHGVHIITFGGEDKLQHYLDAAGIK